ncbi:carbohydrate ABC transporter permease [Metabacillus halosaccharovorans]|uniref:carbohydrate ABC transporter permease n=1 Tax=Metabacillus halosaccharovorans TaxID=930124 RepID=UPI002041E006|nr:carbohydrate ABC transporter permease [Metabacillus halosaccharovorans]MCM3443658.1 carbohydrate ABC transporter permease [Metabacillus halosaccharovorans]
MTQNNNQLITNNQTVATIEPRSGKKKKEIILLTLKYLILIGATVMFMLPLAWTISGSVKPNGEIFNVPITFIPSEFKWENYVNMLEAFPMIKYALNSSIIVAFNVVLNTASSFFVAYGFARFKHKLNGPLFMIVLATMMIPEHVTLVPQFLLFSKLGWVNTYLPLIVVGAFGVPYKIFLMRQFILTLPKELDESAYMDGANSFQVLTKIIAPLCLPIMITMAIMTFNFHWNDFLGPLIYLRDPEKFPLQLGLYALNGERETMTDYGVVFAASITALIPPLVLFLALQKHILSGIKLGGSIKG